MDKIANEIVDLIRSTAIAVAEGLISDDESKAIIADLLKTLSTISTLRQIRYDDE